VLGNPVGTDGLVVRRVEHVGRQADEHRAHRLGGRDLDRPPQHPQQRTGVDDAGGVLGDGLGHRHQVGRHLGVHGVVAHARLAGDDDERRVAAHGLVHHADAVAESDAAVQLHHGRSLRDPGVPVAHRHRDGLLHRQDVVEVGVRLEGIEEALLDGAGIAEHRVDAVGEELLDDRLPAGACRGLGRGRTGGVSRARVAHVHLGRVPLAPGWRLVTSRSAVGRSPAPRPSARRPASSPASSGRSGTGSRGPSNACARHRRGTGRPGRWRRAG
jgi:hypothetical protein